MRRRIRLHIRSVLPVAILFLLFGAPARPVTGQTSPAPSSAASAPAALFDSAYVAWDAGAYPTALDQLDRLLAGPGGGDFLADAAVLTGERYRTSEVAPDGRSPRWSPDGRHLAYDVPGASAVTAVVAVAEDGSTRPVAQLEGYGAVFSGDGGRIAWLRTVDPEALAAEEARIRQATPVQTRADFVRVRDALTDARARHARVRVRDLATGRERDLPATEPVHAVVWSGGEAVPWLRDPAVTVSPGGTHLVFRTEDGLAVLDREEGWQRTFVASTSPAFSADGSTLVFLTRGEAGYSLRRIRLDDRGADTDLPELLLRTPDAMANPALSADGETVAFQRRVGLSWELWVLDGGADEPRRLTHDVQHDLFPAFLADDRLLVIKGEARHRRSYVYPVRPGGEPAIREWVPGLGEGMRLFHNNTIRTVAPEYEWAVSPDGTRVLIVAERDGDTISPERGLYLVDLRRPVTVEEVRARIAGQGAAELDLRRRGEQLFAPIAAAVRDAVADVSVTRIYRYAADLYRFGSKHMTQPGNALAIEYLTQQLREFGYDPELQWFEPAPGVRTANVIARLPGTQHPDVVYLVSSHFDSVERSPGADDNSSGTTALLEAARVLAHRPQPATIEFVFLTAEESGLLGAREFTRRALAAGTRVAGAINNDMIGYANDHRLDNTIRYSNPWVRDVQHAAAFLFTDLILYDARYYRGTDAHALFDAFGDVIGGIGSYPILANPHYHQPTDTLETINQRLVAEVSRATVAAIMRLASRPELGR